MPNLNDFKNYLKDASDDDAKFAYDWATVAMEVRGLISIPVTRKRRSDAGKPRDTGDGPGLEEQPYLDGESRLKLKETA